MPAESAGFSNSSRRRRSRGSVPQLQHASIYLMYRARFVGCVLRRIMSGTRELIKGNAFIARLLDEP